MGVGVSLFLFAIGHHVREYLLLEGLVGPAIALVLDGLPALGIAYAGYCLFQTESRPESRQRVVVWSLSGGLIFVTVIGATFLVRAIEGRSVAEPVFPLLIAFEAGAIAGLVAGYYSARAQADARRARTVNDALAFVNDIIRHDLRNDLTVIEGYGELIENDHAGENAAGEAVDPTVITEKADEGLTRIEATGAITDTLVGEPDLEPTDLAAITSELAARTEATFNATVTTDLPDEALVPANAGLRSVVDNLLENAAEHNDTDDPRIDVTVEHDRDIVRMTVSDNGPGIPEVERESLFDATGTETDGGGLMLTHTLVEGYDGSIRVDDRESGGTTFIVELPRAE
jgi:signal transduction histidine kinase